MVRKKLSNPTPSNFRFEQVPKYIINKAKHGYRTDINTMDDKLFHLQRDRNQPGSNARRKKFRELILIFVIFVKGTEPNERTHLLVDPVTNSPAMRRSDSVDFMTEYPNSLPKKDVQNALIRIVHDNAT